MAKKVYVGVENFIQRNLPYGYTQIEYIKSSGTQYINTGVTATANTTAKYKYSIDQILTYGPHVLSGQSWYFPMVRGSTTGGTFVVNRGGNEVGSSAIAPKTGVIYEVDASFINNKVTVNGVEYGTYAMGNVSVDTAALHLMTYGGAPGDSQFTMSGKLYYCQIYENGTLVRDFVPVKNSAGTIGLYDLANGVFYTNDGSGAFTEGASYKSVARQGKKMYVGIDNVARKAKKGYIGIGGVARPFFSGGELVYYGTITPLTVGIVYPKATSNEQYAIFGGYDTKQNVDAYNATLTKTAATSLSWTARHYAAASNGLYALFGGGADNRKGIVNAYDNSLVQSIPTSLGYSAYYLAGTNIGNFALFGGGDSQNSSIGNLDYVRAYNQSLTRSAPTGLSVARYGLEATHIPGNYAIFAGGQDNNDKFVNTVDAYNESLTRTVAASMSFSSYFLAAAYVGNHALFGGGRTNINGSTTRIATVNAYDKSLTRTIPTAWTTASEQAAGAGIEGFAIFAGGASGNGTARLTEVNAYDESLTKVVVDNLSKARQGIGATNIGNYALFGGGTTNSYSGLTTVDAYTVA